MVGATTQAVLKMGTGKDDSAAVASSRVRNALKNTEGRFDEVLVLEASIMEVSSSCKERKTRGWCEERRDEAL